jgi:hypothetical protein
VLSGSIAAAGTFTFNGSFFQDDNQASFNIVLNSPGTVTITTSSYASGGFAPVLSIFGAPYFGAGDPSLLGTNSGGAPCGVRPTNPDTGLCLDALLGYDSILTTNPLGTLAAGTYMVILTEQDNTPNGPDLASGFNRDGQGNFTAVPDVNDGPFVDPGNPNISDSGNWAVGFQNVDSAAQLGLPEPSTVLSLLGGLVILAGIRRRRTS